jgi:hypothetical protein
MITVLTKNTDSGDILGYDFGDKKDKDQMIHVLAYEGVFLDPEDVDRLNENWTDEASKKDFKKLSRKVANDLSDQFDAQATLSDKIVYATGHASMSLSPVDRERLGKDPYPDMYSEMEAIAREYREKMGITDTQWVLTYHMGTRCPHMHLAYNRVRNDGSVISGKKERPRSMKACEEITKQHKLAIGGEVERNLEALCDKRKAYAQMRLLALDALAASCTIDEFVKNLRKKGIILTITGQGLSFALESGECYAKGSKLDRNALSYGQVEAALQKNFEASQAEKASAMATPNTAVMARDTAVIPASDTVQGRATEQGLERAEKTGVAADTAVIPASDTVRGRATEQGLERAEKTGVAADTAVIPASDTVRGRATEQGLERAEETVVAADTAVIPASDTVQGRATERGLERAEKPNTAAKSGTKKAHADENGKEHLLQGADIEELLVGRNTLAPTMRRVVDTWGAVMQLKKAVIEAQVGLKMDTITKYDELRKTWEQIAVLSVESQNAESRMASAEAIAGVFMLMNPIVGLTVMFLVSIAADIRESTIKVKKQHLLAAVEKLRTDIEQLDEQRTRLKIESQVLRRYLVEENKYKEFHDGLKTVGIHVKDAKLDLLKQEFPFRGPDHIQYIIYSKTDAFIFRAEEGAGTYRSMRTGHYYDSEHKYEIKADYYEYARTALKEKILFVDTDRGPNAFYETLLKKRENGEDYRIGDIFIQPEGKIAFGQERVFGDPEKTEPYGPPIEEHSVRSSATASEKETPAPQEKPAIPLSQAATVPPATTSPPAPSTPPQLEPSPTPPPSAKPVPNVTSVAQQQTAPMPPQAAKPTILLEYKDSARTRFRIKKEEDGTMQLQQYALSKKCPTKGGKPNMVWRYRAKFTSFKVLGQDDTYLYLKVKDGTMTKYINQYGNALTSSQKGRLGVSDLGMNGL